jgi:uncharacterized protein YkwD
LRNLAAAVLSVPIVAALVVSSAVRRSAASRVALLVGMVALVGASAVALAPREVAARPTAAVPVTPVVAARLSGPLQTDAALASSVTIDFSSPMDPASVRAALRVQPATAVALTWEQGGRRLVVTPTTPWDPATYVTVTVDAGAQDATGAVLPAPVRSSFVTRAATAASLAATKRDGKRILTNTAFVVKFDHPVDVAAVRGALKVTPAVKVKVTAVARDGGTVVTITPATRLKADTTYTLSFVKPVLDADGGEVATIARLVARTAAAPAVVRFRPFAKTTDVPRDAVLSVRFTEKMDRKTTAAAFRATANGKAVAGKVRWAEGDTVLVFTPKAELPYKTRVVLSVSTKARSATGAPLAKKSASTFTTVAEPAAPAPKPKAATATTSTRATAPAAAPAPASTSGGVVGGGAWASVERYYLTLVNCTRTGGWVAANGSCTSPGGRDVAPLVYDAEIAAKVARPYAKYLAERAACDHFLDGNPGTRLARAGFRSYVWAENLGCPTGDPRRGAIATQLFFQSEKPYNGGHYVNLMNAKYTHVGIGVWVHGGNVRIVSNFYTP